MKYKTGEEVVLIADGYRFEKGTKLIHLFSTTDSGYFVSFCVVCNQKLHDFLKNKLKSIDDLISYSRNNVNEIEFQLDCIKPFYNEITSKSILNERKKTLEKDLIKTNELLKYF